MTELERELATIVAEIAELEIDEIVPERRLADIGVDSLMSVEIAVWVEQRYGVHFDEADLSAVESFADIVHLTSDKLALVEQI